MKMIAAIGAALVLAGCSSDPDVRARQIETLQIVGGAMQQASRSMGDTSSSAPTPAGAGMECMKATEQTSGTAKICYYNCLGSLYAVNRNATDLCPLSVERPLTP